MPRKAAGVVVTFDAGTAQFFKDTLEVEGRVKAFGQTVNTSMAGSRQSMVAASAAIKELEGNFAGSTRAVGRFLADTLKLGPALAAAFPVIGALSFIGILGKIGEGMYKFVKDVENAPEKINGVFGELTKSASYSLDELVVVNDKLNNDIDRLLGKRENHLKLILDEAKVAMDNLVKSMEHGLDTLHKLLEENTHGFFGSRIRGDSTTEDITKELGGETGFGGFRARIGNVTNKGQAEIDAAIKAKDLTAEIGAQTRLNTEIQKAYNDEIAKFSKQLDEAKGHQATREDEIKRGQPSFLGISQIPRIELLEQTISDLRKQASVAGVTVSNSQLSSKRSLLQENNDNAKKDRPYEDRIKALDAQLAGIQAKSAEIGQSQSAQNIAKGYAEALKIIEEVNKQLERQHLTLTEARKDSIQDLTTKIASAEADAAWATKIHLVTDTIQERIQSQKLLTDAIGQGYEATKNANVETQLMVVYKDHLNDAEFMAAKNQEITNTRSLLAREYDLQHIETISQTIQKLNDQTQIEQALIAVRHQGADAIHEAESAERFRQSAIRDGYTIAKQQYDAEEKLYQARKANQSQEEIEKISEQTFALKSLTDATIHGAEATRKAQDSAKYVELARQGRGVEIPAAQARDNQQHQSDILQYATKTGLEYQNQLEQIGEAIQAIQGLSKEDQSRLSTQISLRNLMNEQLSVLAKQTLQIGGLKDGVRAFFLEMQASSKKMGVVVYDALHSALEQTADELTKLFTGNKFSFGKLLTNIGGGILHSIILEGLKAGLGQLSKVLHPGQGAGGKNPTGTDVDPIYVRPPSDLPDGTENNPIYVIPLGATGEPAPPSSGAADFLKQIGGQLIGAGIGIGIGAGAGQIHGRGSVAHADGGPVSPNQAYWVGERGPEPFMATTSGHMLSNTVAKSLGGGNGIQVGYIDARGSDPAMTYQNVYKAIQASHNDAVNQSIRGSVQRGSRVPKG